MIITAKPFPWKCSRCKERAVRPAVVPYSVEVGHDGRTYQVSIADLEVPKCTHCGRLVFDDAANARVTREFRAQAGLLEPEKIRGQREELGLTQRELANLLGIAEATLSRWETGVQIQQRAFDRFMRVFFKLPEVRRELSAHPAIAS
jgi:putative zinc finger/helix-turn-helix YgiT family protein